MSFSRFTAFRNIIGIVLLLITIYLFSSLQNITDRINNLHMELSFLNVILDNYSKDLQIKKRIIGAKFRKNIISDFQLHFEQKPKYYLFFIEGIMVKNSDMIKLTSYLTSQFSKNNVQIIASVSEAKKKFFKNGFNNDNVYITSSFYSQLNEIIDAGIHDIPILLLDSNGVCIYTFLFHYNCFTQVIENGKIVSSIINSNKNECKN